MLVAQFGALKDRKTLVIAFFWVLFLVFLDDRQNTHLICARLGYDLYDFFRSFLGHFIQEKEQEAGPKHT